MGNSIDPLIQLTGDCPTKNASGKMPVLDLECWTEEGTIWWQHYRKPMTNFLMMQATLAMAWSIKHTTFAQEVVRILRKCRTDLPWTTRAVFLSDLSTRMKASGYTEKFRLDVITAGIKGFEKMVDTEKAGGRPLNRERTWNQTERKKAKTMKKLTWHKTGGYHVPLFIPFTPNGELKEHLQEVEKKSAAGRDLRFKFIERGGISIKNLLQKSDPWANEKCDKEDCFPCKGEKGGSCRRNNVTYKICCSTCHEAGQNAQYIGETGRNMY